MGGACNQRALIRDADGPFHDAADAGCGTARTWPISKFGGTQGPSGTPTGVLKPVGEYCRTGSRGPAGGRTAGPRQRPASARVRWIAIDHVDMVDIEVDRLPTHEKCLNSRGCDL